MNVRVDFYSQLRDVAGASHLDVVVADDTTVRDLLEELYRIVPDLRSHDRNILVAAGVEFVDRKYEVKAGDEIAIMPPVQGG